jgi:transcription elongation factor GreA
MGDGLQADVMERRESADAFRSPWRLARDRVSLWPMRTSHTRHDEAIQRLLPARGGSGAASRPVITPAGRAALSAEIAALRAEHAAEVAERLRDARGFGEAAGNDDYWALLEDGAVLGARIARLERLLSMAVVVEDEPAGDAAGPGDTVVVRDAATGRIDRHTLADARHGWAPGSASIGSPVGQALIGRPVGARVAVQLPSGRARELEVMDIERAGRERAA